MPKTAQAVLDEMVAREIRLGAGPVAAWDLDSTVCSTVHRRHLVPAIRAGGEGAPTWCDYSLLCEGDEPVRGTLVLMRALSDAGYVHVAVSGRSLKAYHLTREWSARHQVPLSGFILRPSYDHSPNGIWKSRVLLAMKRQGADIRMYFEDWAEAARKIEEETGIPVVGINAFDPEGTTPL
jgi:hypothetical protein